MFVDVQGWLRAWKSSACGEKYGPGLIVNGQGYIYFHLFYRDASGKIAPGIELSGSSSLKEQETEIARVPGAVIAVQTFGDFLGFNPHCHILVTDGCFYGKE